MLSICNINQLPIQTFQLSISLSTYKVTHFDIIKVNVSRYDSNKNHFCTALSLFAVLVTFDAHYDSWERESLLRCFVTICCACHLWCPPGITFCYSVNHSWEFHTKDRGGRGFQHRHNYKERRKKRKNNKLNVWMTTASQVSWIFAMKLKLNRSSLYFWQQNMLIVLIICAVFHGATSMNNSHTLLLRFKNNIRSAYTPAIPEDTETWT